MKYYYRLLCLLILIVVDTTLVARTRNKKNKERVSRSQKQNVKSKKKSIAPSKQDSTQEIKAKSGQSLTKKTNKQDQSIIKNARTIRVLLNKASSNTKAWQLSCDKGFIITENNTKKQRYCSSKDLNIQVKSGSVYLNNQPAYCRAIDISPRQGNARFTDKEYNGTFSVVLHKDRVLLINNINLEDYIFSVLRTESWPGWPLEVNKVFAVACRTYAISMVLNNKQGSCPYHVTNTNVHQTYHGVHSCSVIKQAVEQTKGVFLGYKNKPILAMFDSCCGGVIPAKIEDFDFSNAPYLARKYACNHCKQCKIYSWQAEYDTASFGRLLASSLQKNHTLTDIKMIKKDKAGLTREIIFKGKNDKGANILIAIAGKKLYSLLKEVTSFCFDIRKKANKITLNGRGYGHHIGLCQWGAREMVRDGWHHKRILQFYYPGTSFMQLT